MKSAITKNLAIALTAFGLLSLSAAHTQAGLMSPTELPGLQLWLDAQDIQGNGTATTGGQSISTWVDKSGMGNNATAGGGAVDTFVFNDGTLDNGAVLRLNGSNFFTSPVNISRNVMPDVTVVAVYEYRAVDGNDALWGQDNGAWDRFVLLNHSVPEGVSRGPLAPQMFSVPELNQVGGGFDILATLLDAGVTDGSQVRINGSFPAGGGVFTEVLGNAGDAALSIGRIGSGGGIPSQVDFAEFLVYDRVLTPAEENDLGFYLAQKYDLTTSYIPEPSTFALVALGGMALLTRRQRRR